MKKKLFSIFCIFLLIFNMFITSSFAADEGDWFNKHDSSFLDYMLVIKKYYNDNNLTLYAWLLCDNGYIYTFSKSDFSCFVDTFGLIHGDLSCYLFAFNEDNTSDTSYVMHKDLQPHWGMTSASFITKSTFDIMHTDGYVFFKANSSLDFNSYKIELSTNEKTNDPIIAYSNYFNLSDATKYRCYISTNAKDWILMNYETFNDIANNVTKFRFNYKIFKNGCYYFKFLNTETNDENYLSYNVTNIVKNSSNSGFTDSGIPQPFCTYERVNKEFIIKTQSFSASDMQKYRCFYTKTPGNDYSSWDEMSMGSFTNTLTGETEYYFFFTVPSDSEDCTFYFVFYDYTLNEYGAPSSLKCVFDKMNEYADSLNPTVSEKNNRFTELLKYFKERFGFLTYPFEFLINFANRIFNINYSEPVIHIPELRDPFNNNIIFSGLDFNFNSLLNNGTFNYIYNIYLVAVDFVIVVLFIFLCKKEIEEVFGNG